MSITTLVVIGMIEVFLIALAFISAYKEKNEQEFVIKIMDLVSDEERADAIEEWRNSITE